MDNRKHAYLIITHANPFVLEKLMLLIDDERNDIYIHIDKKTKALDQTYFAQLPQKSKVYFTPRLDVRWGDVSQIETELLLFDTAHRHHPYSYYHLISGSDLPVMTQDQIHSFCAQNDGAEFIGFSNAEFVPSRIDKKHILTRYMRSPSSLWRKLATTIRLYYLALQRKLGVNRASGVNHTFVYGSNWVSVTNSFVVDLLGCKASLVQLYSHSYCGDEIYKHTFAFNSKYKDRIYDLGDELRSSMRYMDWHRGRPYTFRTNDFDELTRADRFFARKFEDEVDKEIVQKLFDTIIEQQNNAQR